MTDGSLKKSHPMLPNKKVVQKSDAVKIFNQKILCLKYYDEIVIFQPSLDNYPCDFII